LDLELKNLRIPEDASKLLPNLKKFILCPVGGPPVGATERIGTSLADDKDIGYGGMSNKFYEAKISMFGDPASQG
jgi:hypothetical protein